MLFYAAPCYSNATYVIPCSANYSMVMLAGRALGPHLAGFVLRAGCLVWVPDGLIFLHVPASDTEKEH